MRGKMDNVKIDSSKATKKITLLLAWQKADAAGAFAGGPAGALIGGLLNRMATLPTAVLKSPLPNTPPLGSGKAQPKKEELRQFRRRKETPLQTKRKTPETNPQGHSLTGDMKNK